MDTPYDPAAVTLAYAGGFLEEGAMDGTFIEVSRNEDSATLKVGATGEQALAVNQNRSGTIKITVLQTSKVNNLLSAQLAAWEAGDFVTAIQPVLMKDLLGSTIIGGASCWVRKFADVQFAKEIMGREWTLEIGRMDMLVGGSL